jgi:hypothetical protein
VSNARGGSTVDTCIYKGNSSAVKGEMEGTLRDPGSEEGSEPREARIPTKAGVGQSWLYLSPLLDHAFLLVIQPPFPAPSNWPDFRFRASITLKGLNSHVLRYTFCSHVRLPSFHSALYQDYTMEIPCNVTAGPSRRQRRSTHSVSFLRTSHTGDVTPPARDTSRQASLRLDFIIIGGGKSRSHVPDNVLQSIGIQESPDFLLHTRSLRRVIAFDYLSKRMA